LQWKPPTPEELAQLAERVKYSVDRAFYEKRERCTLPRIPEFLDRTPAGLTLPTGLHLLFAPAGGGKTLTALGLYTWLVSEGVNASYEYAYEPNAERGVDKLTPAEHEAALKGHCVLNTPSACIFDALSLALRMLPEVDVLAKRLGDQAYAGGLKPADLAGAALHNWFATKYRICLIATVNSEMLPIVKALSGAVTGIFQIGTPGTISGTDRTDRVLKPIVIPDTMMNVASKALGYGEFNLKFATPGRI
jgi:hypothetical protein